MPRIGPLHRLLRRARLASLAAGVLLAATAPVQAQSQRGSFEFPMSPDMQARFAQPPVLPAASAISPLLRPVLLRFHPAEHFSYGWNGFGNFSPGNAFLTEGFVMQGSVRAAGDALVWHYTLANLGHDRVLRQWAEIEATTDARGNPSAARLLAKTVPEFVERMRPGSYAYLDPEHFRFPLCCLPAQPLRQNESFAGSLFGAGPDSPVRTTVRGMLREAGRSVLLLENTARITVNTEGHSVPSTLEGVARVDVLDPTRRSGLERVSATGELEAGRVQTIRFLHAIGDGGGEFLRWR